MENHSMSTHSLTNSLPPSKARKEPSSGSSTSSWNFYIERFYDNDIDEEETCFSTSDFGNTSSFMGGCSKCRCFENVGSKNKKRKRHLAYDDALEDTASSPLKSPKVGEYENITKCPEKVEDKIKGLGASSAEEEVTGLKKKGFCLVPRSLVAKYIKIGESI